ncbi:MAG: porin family protein [Muribaculaceae bacterium]|nr:porin family protein [Muribaculaceae bacterium]
MKKVIVFACVAVLALVASAQVRQHETAVGANLIYGSEIERVGLGARFQYGILDQLRAEVGFNGFVKNHDTSWWDVNLNAHYLLSISQDKFYVYPITGLNYTMVSTKIKLAEGNKKSVEDNHIGLNLGAGVEYELNEHWGVNAEYRHTIIRKVDQGVFGVGINYKF